MKSPTEAQTPHDHHHAMHASHESPRKHDLRRPVAGVHGESAAHDRHEGHSVAMFRDRFWITLLLSLPTLVWSGMVQHMVGFSAPVFPGSAYIPALFGTAVYVSRADLAGSCWPNLLRVCSCQLTIATSIG
jgi:P-type Cu2+ transporter